MFNYPHVHTPASSLTHDSDTFKEILLLALGLVILDTMIVEYCLTWSGVEGHGPRWSGVMGHGQGWSKMISDGWI